MNKVRKYTLEACVSSFDSVQEAVAGGANRLELCTHLSCGGLTPSMGLIEKSIEFCDIPIHILIRPRAGDFVYTNAEQKVIAQDIDVLKKIGVAGVVCGFLLSDDNIDVELLQKMVKLASPMSFTFHRAFDICHKPLLALEEIIDAGCYRLLTSGQKNTAIEGKILIAELIQEATGRINIMSGSGINKENIEELINIGGQEFHMSGSERYLPKNVDLQQLVQLSEQPKTDQIIWKTSRVKIAEVRKILNSKE